MQLLILFFFYSGKYRKLLWNDKWEWEDFINFAHQPV